MNFYTGVLGMPLVKDILLPNGGRAIADGQHTEVAQPQPA